ncbi:MAG: hypothetical protein JNM27_02290 [Leptospirales bacterium]|nr:hypothetical protein [Leptospirales bacterium]
MRTSRGAFAAAFLFTTFALHADTLLLKSGDSIEGFYQQEEAGIVTFVKLNGEKITVASEEVENIDFAQSGVPACIQLKNDAQPKCDLILASLSADGIVVAEGKAKRSVKRIPLADVKLYQLRKIADHQKLAGLLPEDKRVVLTLANRVTLTGKVTLDGESIKITDASGASQTIAEAQITAADVNFATQQFRWFNPRNFIIGYPQYKSGRKIPGAAMMGGFGLLWLGFGVEYMAAVSDNKKAHGDPTVLLLNNQSYLKSFNRHQANQRNFAVGAMLLYAFHWFDLYRHRDENVVMNLELTAPPRSALALASSREDRRPANLSLVFSMRY